MITIENTIFPEVKILTSIENKDNRGSKYDSYSENDLINANIKFKIKEEIIYHIPVKNTLYGIHFQNYPKKQQKIISLVLGTGVDYVIDLRKDSKTYKKWFSIELNHTNQKQIVIPYGFGHLFRSITDNVIMSFKIDEYFDNAYSNSISYKDPEIGLDIMHEKFVLSRNDEMAPSLKDSNCNFR
jgi:dTDP-4-dehydrorhamnose 3,5-epimerase